MGWSGNVGLGKSNQGIVDPVRLEAVIGSMGLGKATQYDEVAVEVTAERVLLESEKQAGETEQERMKRETKVKKVEEIKASVAKQNETFFCGVCSKQYALVADYEEHLSSYDHHHTKRLAEMRQADMRRKQAARCVLLLVLLLLLLLLLLFGLTYCD